MWERLATVHNVVMTVFRLLSGDSMAVCTVIVFEPVLKKKNAEASFRQVINYLKATQQPIWSPLILSGRGFGMWANHSLVMASYISRANAGIIDLVNLLAQG